MPAPSLYLHGHSLKLIVRNTRWKAVGLALLALACHAAQAETYSYTGPNFTAFTNFTVPCATAPCANFSAGMRIQGTFTTAAPLAASLTNQNILALVTSFSFTDGLTTYSSADPLATLMNAAITTDAAGVPVSMTFIPVRWHAAAPHAVNDRVDYLFVTPAATFAWHNARCTTLSGPTGCSGMTQDASSGGGAENAAVRPAPALAAAAPAAVTAVPSLDDWSLLVLATMVGLAGLALARRQDTY